MLNNSHKNGKQWLLHHLRMQISGLCECEREQLLPPYVVTYFQLKGARELVLPPPCDQILIPFFKHHPQESLVEKNVRPFIDRVFEFSL